MTPRQASPSSGPRVQADCLLLGKEEAPPVSVVGRFDNEPDPVTGKRRGFTDAASVVRTGDGSLLCAIPWFYCGPQGRFGRLTLHRSTDEGTTWEAMRGEWGFLCGKLHRIENRLYFVGVGPTRADGIQAITSEDDGRSWSDPIRIFFEQPCYNPSAGTVLRDGILYLCFGVANAEGRFNAAGSRVMAASVPASRIMEPEQWRFSELLEFPVYPDSFRHPEDPDTVRPSHWLEGNVVETQRGLRTYWRTRIDPCPGEGLRSISPCAVCELEEAGGTLHHRFKNFQPLPGAYNHFHIWHDAPSNLHWLLANQPAGRLARRNILGLFCSVDAAEWVCTGYPVVFPEARQAASYVSPLVDGENLLIVSRTAWASTNNHDNDLVTFHKIPRFRALADLLPLEKGPPDRSVRVDSW